MELFQHQKSIKGYEDLYTIDNKGNVRSLITNRSRRKGIIKPYLKNGYLAVNLYKNGKCKHFYIHRLVAEMFIPNFNNYPEVNHIDCNKHNNAIENLEWCNRHMNLEHSYINGLKRSGELHGNHKLTVEEVKEIRNLINKLSQIKIAKRFGVSQSTVSAIKNNRIWKEGD